MFDFYALLLSIIAWIIGDSGKIFLAAGAGGLVRWFTTETKSLKEGVFSVIGAYFIGGFLWPLTLQAPTFFGYPAIEVTADNIYAAAFVTGTVGISLTKFGIAFVEVYGLHWIGRYKDKE